MLRALHLSSIRQCKVYSISPIAYPLPHPPKVKAYSIAKCVLTPDNAHIPTSDPFSRAMAEIAAHAPALRYNADSICYTDGSKYGTSITSAWVHPETNGEQALSLRDPPSPQRTSFRGELIGLHAALHSPAFPWNAPLHVMTDSLTGLLLVNAHLVRPAHLRHNKHRWLVAAIAQNLLARQAPTYLTKF